MEKNTILLVILAFSTIFLTNIVRFKIAYIVSAIKQENALKLPVTKSDEAYMLGSYFYGYVISQIPLAILGKCYNNGKILGICFILTGIVNMSLWYAETADFIGRGRILIGLLQGGSYPLIHGIWHEFATKKNLSNLVSIEYAGGGFGAFLAAPVCILLAFWRLSFLVLGACCCLVGICWIVFILYMEDAQQIQRQNGSIIENFNKIPWGSILTSIPFWGLVIPQLCSNYGSYTIQLLSVNYIVEYLGINLTSAGWLSSIPNLCKPIFCIIAGFMTHKVIKVNQEQDNRLRIRQALSWILFGVTTICFMVSIFIKENVYGIIFLMSLIMGMDGLGPAAFKANFIEIAPSLAGVVFSIANSFGNMPGFIAPYVCHYFLDAFPDQPQTGWNLVFSHTGAVCILGAIVCQIFGTVKQQKWDPYRPEPKNQDPINPENIPLK